MCQLYHILTEIATYSFALADFTVISHTCLDYLRGIWYNNKKAYKRGMI